MAKSRLESGMGLAVPLSAKTILLFKKGLASD